MTPLEQFNEETKKELTEVFERTFFALGSCAAYGNSKPDSAFIDFITQKLAAHKELILKMVRERAPKEKTRQYGSSTYLIGSKGWNDCRQEFLDNLDTI